MPTYKIEGSGKSYEADVEGKCPFCGGEVSFGMKATPFAAHSIPYCETFNDLDVLEFIQAVNSALGVKVSDDACS